MVTMVMTLTMIVTMVMMLAAPNLKVGCGNQIGTVCYNHLAATTTLLM